MQTFLLSNQRTRVPSDSKVYINKQKFDRNILTIIDTNVIYEKFDSRNAILARDDYREENNIYDVIRFYPNGCFNIFFINKTKNLSKQNFDPNYTGYRGVYYNEGSKIKFDLFAEVDQQGHIGKLSGILEFNGDKLILKRDDLKYSEIYIKNKIPNDYLKFNPEW